VRKKAAKRRKRIPALEKAFLFAMVLFLGPRKNGNNPLYQRHANIPANPL
jgi:hypothetical protein